MVLVVCGWQRLYIKISINQFLRLKNQYIYYCFLLIVNQGLSCALGLATFGVTYSPLKGEKNEKVFVMKTNP